MRRGKCLDAAWVANMSTGLDLTARDSWNRMLYPLFRPALKTPRFYLHDPRHIDPAAFDATKPCGAPGDVIALHGVGETTYGNGQTANPGSFQGTFTLELNNWDSHIITTAIMAILVQEVGYNVSYLSSTNGLLSAERMSSTGSGRCSPVHINMETWATGKTDKFAQVANETTASIVGYDGLSGMYTLAANVKEGLKGQASATGMFTAPQSPDFWRDFSRSDELIRYYATNNSNVHGLASDANCANATNGGRYGCMAGCSKTKACSVNEAMGKPCMMIAMMSDYYDPGYLQAITDNNNVPTYHCFLGKAGLESYVTAAIQSSGNSVAAFYHYEPGMFHILHQGQFVRVAWPRAVPESVQTNTATYGELGYGNGTTNPVNVDFPQGPLYKYSSYILATAAPMLQTLVAKFQLSQLDINNLLRAEAAIYMAAGASPPLDPWFPTACQWVKANYKVWQPWIDRLPLCSIESHMLWGYEGCSASNISTTSADGVRTINFAWQMPDPDDASLPYNCDGGWVPLPATFPSSRSCDWLRENEETWMSWISQPPKCDATFFSYSVSACRKDCTRSVAFFWLLPDATGTRSIECVGGVTLPPSVTIDCDFVPSVSTTASLVFAMAVVVMAFAATCIGVVVRFHNRPIIKRAQWPLLLTLLAGAIVMCVYVTIGAGMPSSTICALRPLLASIGFTLTFGSIVVKSLRVYLVFNHKAMKKVQVPLSKMLHILASLVGVDLMIVVVWLVVDFPSPTTTTTAAAEFAGTVDHLSCHSSSFIFTALTVFWKAIVLFAGIYLSFLIRHADADFQESLWIFASACVILMASLIMLPLAYLVNLPAAIDYSFRSTTILLSTVILICLMFGPKLIRLNNHDNTTHDTTKAGGGHHDKVTAHHGAATVHATAEKDDVTNGNAIGLELADTTAKADQE
ncbi:Aste57867_14799 [Aphanomyces stellatus]|uniref:Aste57867_14799 protein n=1 Tax=Aphanomyces stellatus TaxID=120398 RepID=A0A485L2J1_9STRA|nr:hypothetical protein As57867_014744 [Aphanomyces stellatus]VFT91617.1 Aste57867_14799 [Aphanomyces stellatus]